MALVALVALVALGLACTPAPCGEEAGDLCLVAGTGKLGFNRDGLPPVETEFYLVSSARRGPDGRLYLVDFNNQRLRRLGDDGRIETIAGNGFHAIADLGLPAVESPLENPIDLRFLSDGRLVFVSYHDPRVLALTPEGALERLAGDPEGQVGVDGDEGDGGSPLDARFIQLDGIAVAKDGAIYVSDSRAHRVRRIHGGVITTVAGTGEAGFSGDGGAATEAALFWPTALEVDDDGDLWIADTFNHRIRRLRGDQTIENRGARSGRRRSRRGQAPAGAVGARETNF